MAIGGENKAFEDGTIQSRWKCMYHEFRVSMCHVLNDPDLEKLTEMDGLFAMILKKHEKVGDIWFNF